MAPAELAQLNGQVHAADKLKYTKLLATAISITSGGGAITRGDKVIKPSSTWHRPDVLSRGPACRAPGQC
jgi:hypothetical protein